MSSTEQTDPIPAICGLVDETAAQNGDPVHDQENLEAMELTELRNLAADVDTEAVSGRSTRLEITAYFSCPRPLDAVAEHPGAVDK